jgi:hypothetical protein
MPFNFDDVIRSLDDSFRQGGAAHLNAFVADHLTVTKWIVASDYNIRTAGASNDVYAFACYPMIGSFKELGAELSTVFPADFKRTRQITREHRRFLDSARCFSFVFLVLPERKLLRSGDQAADRDHLHQMLDASLQAAEGLHHVTQIAHLRRLREDSGKGTFSLARFEDLLLLCTFHAFISCKLAFRMSLDLIGWFPDRDNMTTY